MASILNWEDHSRLNTYVVYSKHSNTSATPCFEVFSWFVFAYVLDGAIISLFGAKAGGKIAKLSHFDVFDFLMHSLPAKSSEKLNESSQERF